MVIFSDGFETNDFTAWTGTNGAPTVVNTQKHHGTYSMFSDDVSEWCHKTFVTATTIYTYWWIRLNQQVVHNYRLGLGALTTGAAGTGTEIWALRLIENPAWTWQWRLGTPLANYEWQNQPVANTWINVKVQYTKNNGAGIYKMWVDDVLRIDQTGLATTWDPISQVIGTISGDFSAGQQLWSDCVAVDSSDIAADPFAGGGGVTVKKSSSVVNAMAQMLNSKMLFSQCNPHGLKV